MVRRASASVAKRSAPAPEQSAAQKRNRIQDERRTVDMKVERFMQEKIYGKLAKDVIETKRADGQLLREAVAARIEQGLVLSPSFMKEILTKYDALGNVFEGIEVAEMKTIPSDAFIDALDRATVADNKTRTVDPLILHVQYSNALHPKESSRVSLYFLT